MICRWHAGIDKSLYKPAGKEYHTSIKLFIKAYKEPVDSAYDYRNAESAGFVF